MLSELAAELRAARAESRRDIEAIRGRFEPELTRLRELLADNADLLAQLAPRVGSLDSELADLGERLDALTEGSGAAASTTAWPSLPSAAAAKEWAALGTWLDDVLGPFYGITRRQVPDCWALHPRVVVELVWLRRCYVAAHAPAAPATLSADWHTRLLRDALANITEAMPGRVCGPGRHQSPEEHQQRQQERYAQPPRQQQVWQPNWEPGPPEPRYGRPTHDEHPPAYDAAAVGASSQVISREHWGRFYDQAVREDLDRRLQREKTSASVAAAGQVLSPPPRRPPPR
ncbi:MAG: hypothetical protein AB7G17_13615 [Phycisphaerales bacterium]